MIASFFAMALVTSISEELWNKAVLSHGSIGVVVVDVDVVAKNIRSQGIVPPRYGLYVKNVIEKSPAYKAGIRPGQIIMTINGVTATYKNIEKLQVGRAYIIGIGQVDHKEIVQIVPERQVQTDYRIGQVGMAMPISSQIIYHRFSNTIRFYTPRNLQQPVVALYCERPDIK
jgi:membrane-associated protease RseP (regulator of RpoE activity)